MLKLKLRAEFSQFSIYMFIYIYIYSSSSSCKICLNFSLFFSIIWFWIPEQRKKNSNWFWFLFALFLFRKLMFRILGKFPEANWKGKCTKNSGKQPAVPILTTYCVMKGLNGHFIHFFFFSWKMQENSYLYFLAYSFC